MENRISPNPLIPYLGDINYKKPRLTLHNIDLALSDIGDVTQKLAYIEEVFSKIRANKKEEGTFYNEVGEQYQFLVNEGQWLTYSQMKDIWGLKIAYLRIVSQSKDEFIDKNSSPLLDFDMGKWSPENQLSINVKQTLHKLSHHVEGSGDVFSEWLSKNQEVTMDGVRPELHWNFVHLMQLLGYKSDPGGVCKGLCGMYLQAVLIGEAKVFEHRLDQMLSIPYIELEAKVMGLKNKLDNDIKLNNEEIDLLALFDGIKLYISLAHHPEVIPKEGRAFYQDINVSKKLTTSVALEKKGGFEEVKAPELNTITTMINDSIKGCFFASLLYILKLKSLDDQPFALMLNFMSHSVQVGYDPKEKKWSYLDINCLPIKYVNKPDELSDLVLESNRALMSARRANFNLLRNRYNSFTAQLYVTQDTESAFTKTLENWQKFWYQNNDPSALKELLHTIPAENRFDFLRDEVGFDLLQKKINQFSSSLQLEFLLDNILPTLPEMQSDYFLQDFLYKLNPSLVKRFIQSPRELNLITKYLTEEQKKYFIQVYGLEKYIEQAETIKEKEILNNLTDATQKQTFPRHIIELWDASTNQSDEEKVLTLLKDFTKKNSNRGLTRFFTFMHERDEIDEVVNICEKSSGKNADQLLSELKDVQRKYKINVVMNIIICFIESKLAIEPTKQLAPKNEQH